MSKAGVACCGVSYRADIEPPDICPNCHGPWGGDAAYRHAVAVCDEATAAARAVLARSVPWLILHPVQHRRLRARLVTARAALDALRRERGWA